MGEIEAEMIGRDQRAPLLYVLAQDFFERCVHQVGGRVVEDDSLPARAVDRCMDRFTANQMSFGEYSCVSMKNTSQFDGVLDHEIKALTSDVACIAHLSAGFCIKRGLATQQHCDLQKKTAFSRNVP